MTRPAEDRRIAGIILAGGQSRRMGTDKAALDFGGSRLIDIARSLLDEAGCGPVFVSGRPEEDNAIPDSQSGSGPAQAMLDCLEFLGGDFDGTLFLPVDMPLLRAADLAALLSGQDEHCRAWENHPLPVFIPAKLSLPPRDKVHSIRSLLAALPVRWLALPDDRQARFANLNTAEELTTALKMH